MITPLVARPWFAVAAVVVLAGLVLQVVATARLDSGYFDSDASRIANVFCFFTVQSNLIARRGPLVAGYDAFPSIDVSDHGYPRVLLSCAVVAALILLLAAGAHLLDERLPRR